MRNGPHPLLVHLGIVASNVAGVQEYATAIDAPQYDHDQMVETIRGIQMYQKHPYSVTNMQYEIVYRQGDHKVLKARSNNRKQNATTGAPILLVPSLINKSSILDINENMSLLRWLHSHGCDVYLLDWGDMTNGHEASITMSDVIHDRIKNSVNAVADMHNNAPVDLLGYCMGGVLCAGFCSLYPELVRRMVLLATPWDFHDKSNLFAKNVRIWGNYVEPIMLERGYVPSEWIQAIFAGYDPNGSVHKFARFASMDQNSAEARLFVSVEDWLNDGVSLPAAIAQHCMQEWFMNNVLLANSWTIDDQKLDLSKIKKDVLLIASSKDKLVPFSCAYAAKETMTKANTKVLERSSGHIGLIIGKNAIEEVWKPILEWLEKI